MPARTSSRTRPARPYRRLPRPLRTLVPDLATITPDGLRRVLRIYPPLICSGIVIKDIAPDWSRGLVHLYVTPLTRNMHDAAFGGSLYAMTDVLFGTLVMQRLGPREYEAWTRTGSIEYLRPGRRRVELVVDVPDALIDELRTKTADGTSLTVPHTSVLRGPDDEVVAVAHQELYVRRRRTQLTDPGPAAVPGAPTGAAGDAAAPSTAAAGAAPRGQALVAAARAIACVAHHGQVDKAGRPYVGHLERVARACLTPEARATAWLHDILEDTSVTVDELRSVPFPESVVDAVVLLARRADVPNEEYLAHIHADDLAREVKLADIADNADPRRLAELDDATRTRLIAKYDAARAALRTPAHPESTRG